MGNSSSTGETLTQEEKDIRHLGDRVPFGDAELKRLYRCYYAIESTSARTSFLTDWAMHTVEGDENQREERAVMMQVVETKILPAGFGNRLYATAFLKQGDKSIYEDKEKLQGGDKKPVQQQMDEYTRVSRLKQFFDGISNCGRRGTKAAVKILVNCCEPVELEHQPMIRATELVNMSYRIALSATFLGTADKEKEEQEAEDNNMLRFLPADDKISQQVLESLAQSIFDHAKQHRTRNGLPELASQAEEELLVSCDDVLEWVDDVAPLFATPLSTFTFRTFCPGQPYPPSRTEFLYPVIPQESAFFESGSSPLLFLFACMSSYLGGHFYRLYTSLSDGLSFNRLQNSLLGYGGPTLMLLRSTEGDLFGAFTASSWKESKDFYGSSDCFLFQLLPKVAIYRPSGNGTNFMYCNSHARSRGYDNQAHGVGFGGTVDEPRLFISESWDNCSASSRDMTFDNGPLLGTPAATGDKHFDVEALEVWGVGGEEVVAAALGDRVKARAVKDAAINKARKVDKAAFLDDFKSGIIESKAFAHRDQARGRADADLDDRDGEEKARRF